MSKGKSFYDMTDAEKTEVPESIRDYSWWEAFGYADDFGIGDVAEVLRKEDGENDGPEWIGVFRLKDGRFAYVAAGCDYTGWDCQAGGTGKAFATIKDCVVMGLTDEYRRRLGVRVDGDIITFGEAIPLPPMGELL
jgi:hypothetical protein